MQFKIPQNVQMEDKIVGPLTLKQLMIVGLGGGIDYFLYVSLAKVYVLVVWVLPVSIIGIITLLVAFVRIQGMSFFQYVLSAIEFNFIPRRRVWAQGAGEVFVSITQPAPKSKNELNQEKQKNVKIAPVQSLEELAKNLDTYSQILKQG
jgi:hypothetical protein